MFASQFRIIVVYEHDETYTSRIFVMPNIPSTSSLGLFGDLRHSIRQPYNPKTLSGTRAQESSDLYTTLKFKVEVKLQGLLHRQKARI